MRIHSLEMRNVRAVEHLVLDDLPDTGVIVIHGDNEEGKSTILDALHVVLSQKHNFKNKHVKPLQPVARDVPMEVSVRMSVGPVELSITKRWFRRVGAELTVYAPQPASYTGGEAEDKLAEILDTYLDSHLRDTLFLRQNELDAGVAAAGIPSLERALDSGKDTDADAGDSDALIAAARAEYLKYYYPKRGLKDTVKKLQADREKAAEELAEAKREAAALQDSVDRVERLEAELKQAKTELPEARKHVEEATAEVEALTGLEGAVDKAAEVSERRRVELEARRRTVTQRRELEKRYAEAEKKRTELADELATAIEKAEQESEQVDTLSAELEKAKAQREEIGEKLRESRRIQRVLADLRTREELATTVAQLRDLDETADRLRSRLAGLTVTSETVRQAEKARRELEVAERIREIATPHLELSATAETEITVDDEAITLSEDARHVALHDGTTVHIGEVTAQFRAGSTGGDDPEAAVREAEKRLTAVLEEAGCEDVETLRARRDERSEVDSELQRNRQRRSDVLHGRDADELRAKLAHLDEVLDDDSAVVERDEDELASEVETREAELSEAEEAVRHAEVALEPIRSRNAFLERTRIQARYEGAEEERDRLHEELTAQREEAGLEELEESAAQAEQAHDEAIGELKRLRERLAAADPEGKRGLLEAARARLESLQSRIHDHELECAGRSSSIEQAAGVAEKVDICASRDETLKRELHSTLRQAEAAKLVYETLVKHRSQTWERYAQPYVDELSRLARPLFGEDVSFGLDENLRITGRTIGNATVPLAELSGGTKEQLAILSRFAIASLIARGDEKVGAPLVVDDALGSTDPGRLQRMGQLFSKLGQDTQMIVLTCFPQRYDWVHPKTQYQMTQLKAVED